MTQKVVTKIAANPLLQKKNDEFKRLRVAAYCRVSTDMEDQVESYKAQIAYYTDVISKNPRWELAGIYADEGLTGTQTQKRKYFNRMISDCMKGKVDYILTKSVARFARNTVDSLKYARKLKAQGIGIYFEEQHLDTLKEDSEMVLGIYSVLAQSESENISANVRWGIRQRMKSGTYKFRYNIFGYRRGENGEPEIVEEEAKHIRKIFEIYLDGGSLAKCKEYLEANHVLTRRGGSVWDKTLIKSMLTNEKYCGDMLLQKTYIVDCISHKSKRNRGELPKYLISNSHPAIIDRDTFKLVQAEMSRRASKRRVSDKAVTELGRHSGRFALSDVLVCGECGSPYRRKTWIDSVGEKKRLWSCLNRIEHGVHGCLKSVNVYEEQLHEAICRGLMQLYDAEETKKCLYAALVFVHTRQNEASDVVSLESRLKECNEQLDETILLCGRTQGDKTKYENEIQRLTAQITSIKEHIELEKKKLESNSASEIEIKRIMHCFENRENFLTYSDTIIRNLVESIRVMGNSTIIITLKGGIQVTEKVEKPPRRKSTKMT